MATDDPTRQDDTLDPCGDELTSQREHRFGPSPADARSDEELAASMARGDVAAFGVIYDRHVETVFALGRHLLGAADAEEAVQEIFLRVWDRSRQFEPARGPYRPWLLSIARHYILDQLRRRSLAQRLHIASDVEAILARVDDGSLDVAEGAWQHQRARAVRTALRAIPEEQRTVLLLAYFGGLSQSDIAQQLQSPLGTVKKRVRLGMQKLRENLQNLGLFEDDSGSDRDSRMKR